MEEATCDMAIQTGDWACPEGPTRRADLAPKITRSGGSSAPWRLTCEGCDLWGGPWKLKGDATKALEGCSPAGMRQWYAAAYERLERDGRSLCTARAVDAPESACDRWQVEPCLKIPDWDGVTRGRSAWCGEPICPYWQNTACPVAQRRLGWDDKRVSAAYVAAQYEPDRIRWYAALEQAGKDLRAGLGDEEAAALGATDETRAFLRFDDERRAALGRSLWSLTGRDVLPYYDPESWVAESTCWGRT